MDCGQNIVMNPESMSYFWIVFARHVKITHTFPLYFESAVIKFSSDGFKLVLQHTVILWTPNWTISPVWPLTWTFKPDLGLVLPGSGPNHGITKSGPYYVYYTLNFPHWQFGVCTKLMVFKCTIEDLFDSKWHYALASSTIDHHVTQVLHFVTNDHIIYNSCTWSKVNILLARNHVFWASEEICASSFWDLRDWTKLYSIN